jgi:thioredoxin reductase (NADPH)
VTAIHDVIIIGSGPAGYTAALYAARAQLKPLVFEGSVTAGGALMNTTDVENYPGFPGGITGPDLMDAMRKQAERFGAKLVAEDVTEVDLRADPKRVIVEGETYLAKAVIIATGSGYRELGVPGEKRLGGHGVSWCATCDGFFFRDQDIAVVGGGDSAMEEATFLTRFGRTVTVIHRRDRLRASKIMQERAFANPKIKFRWNSEVTEILGEEKITGLRLRDTVTGEEGEHARGGRAVRGDRARPAQRVVHRAAGHRRRGLPAGRPALHADGHPRRVRLRRRGRPDVPPGRDRGGHRVCRGA